MNEPKLAALVTAGEGQTEAVAINDFIFMVKDISNAYLVTTADGDLLVNTGFMAGAERNKTLLAPRRTGALRRIILTQGHPDHYGGVPGLREDGTAVIAECRFTETCQYFRELGPYFGRRTGKLWGSTLRRGAAPVVPPEIVPDLEIDQHHGFEQGGRRFELISTPGGETLCSLVVWLPQERVVFTGNLFGPVFLSMPNLCTVRGDKPRLVKRFLHSLDRVRGLGAELLITGHGEPIRGTDRIRADLDKLHAAVTYVDEATIAGMNAGKDVFTLMREIRLPRSSIDADLAELAGGAKALAARAGQKLAAGHVLESLHLLDIALGAEPGQAEALAVKKAALEQLLAQSGGANFSETMWLRSEIAAIEQSSVNE